MSEVSNTNQEPLVPELHVPVGSEYRTLNVDLPLEQPMLFYLDGSKAFYLPHEFTTDENTHLPQSVSDTLTNKRIFQEISIKQGQSGMFHSPLWFVTKDGSVDMTNYHIRFEGSDSSKAEIFTDVGFDPKQANMGVIDWSPEEIVSQSPGYYTNAHFVIESPDRSKIYTTLDFSLNIIGNSVYYPRVMEFYVSEYTRALAHIKEMQTSADHQLSYLLNLYAAIVADALANLRKQMSDAKAELDTNLKDGNEKIDDYVADQDKKLDAMNTEITASQGKVNDLETQIHADNLVTTDGLYSSVQLGINSGQIDPHINDVIVNTDVSTKIDSLTDALTEGVVSE